MGSVQNMTFYLLTLYNIVVGGSLDSHSLDHTPDEPDND